MVNPSTRLNTIELTMSDWTRLVAGAVSLADVDQGNPIDNSNTASGNSNNHTVNVTVNTANAWLVDTLGRVSTATITVGAGQTERWNRTANGPTLPRIRGAGSTAGPVPLGTNAMQWTGGNAQWALAAVAVRPAGAGSSRVVAWREIVTP